MARPTNTPPAQGWHDYPCRDCGTLVRCGDKNTWPQCDDCRGKEIASWYESGRYMGD